jgi:CheY-like chemotaxis protein
MDKYKKMIILIAEDDDGHADLIKEGLVESGVCNEMLRYKNGQEIWDFLSEFINSPELKREIAYLLLLDINMPLLDGVEVLRRMKSSPLLKDIPVIMLTTTDDPREVEECYKLGCNAYVTKPVDFAKFAETLHNLGLFIQIVKI